MGIQGVERYVPESECCEIVGLSRKGFQAWARRNNLEKYKFGRSVRYRYNQLVDLIERSRVSRRHG